MATKDCNKFVTKVNEFIVKIKLPEIEKRFVDEYFTRVFYRTNKPDLIDIEYETYIFYSLYNKYYHLIEEDSTLKASHWVDLVLFNSNPY